VRYDLNCAESVVILQPTNQPLIQASMAMSEF